MCPNRFIPLYQLSTLYRRTQQTDKLIKTAREIIDKPIKIDSEQIFTMKKEMKDLLEEMELNFPLQDHRRH